MEVVARAGKAGAGVAGLIERLLRPGRVAEIPVLRVARRVDVTARAGEVPELRREVLTRWGEVMQAHGLDLFRFVIANRNVVHEVRPDKGGMLQHLQELQAILAPPNAGVEDQLRVRMALMSINLAGMAGADIDAPDEEILAAARRISLGLLPE